MVIRSAAVVGSFTLVSRILGFIRDILIAFFLGAGAAGDAFFIAFKLPNLFRRLFAEGAFNLAFVPLFSGKLTAEGKSAAFRFAEEALSVLLVVLLIFVGLSQIAMPWLVTVIAPGFVNDPETFDLTVYLARLTFPYLLFISLVSLLSGLLNSFERFASAAFAPVLLNLCLIGALLILGSAGAASAIALAWGVAVAGVVQFLWLSLNCYRCGILLNLRYPALTPSVRRLLSLMLPAVVGAGVVQLNLVVDMIIASLLPGGSVSHLYYADRIAQLPLGVIGVAMGIALLPSLSRQVAAGDGESALATQNQAIEFSLIFAIPASLGLLIIAEPVIYVLFERGAFTAVDTSTTAAVLAAYALGLPAFILIKVLAPGYFARKDTRTPVQIAILALLVNVVLNILLMGPLGVAGIALASSVA
jgi:putative peptidoglycan lipid II flippase